MNKNVKYLTLAGAIVVTALATYGVASDITHFIKAPASKEYELVFDRNNNFNSDITAIMPGENDVIIKGANYEFGTFDDMPVATKDGYNGLSFFFEGAYVNPDGYVTLGPDGGFGNSYINKNEHHGKINGIKEIIVNYTGGELTANYGYEKEMINNEYRVTSQPIKSGVPYDFNGANPQYFSINTSLYDYTYIKDIKVYYSCEYNPETIPSQTFHTSGYHVGALKNNKLYKGVATSATEARKMIDLATALHYDKVQIKFAFNNQEDELTFIDYRRSFAHVYVVGDNYKTGTDITNTFTIIYSGDTSINTDLVRDPEGDYDKDEIGIGEHRHVASYYTQSTPAYDFKTFQNASTQIRKKYATENNLLRDPSFNDFAIDKLDDSKYFDVYNSEELWWAALNGYKPRFPLENSKAEWIYNEAKKILNTIIYKGMSKEEKARAIYDWIILSCHYDYDALNSGRIMEENVAYYLEGIFERRRGVCDSFSKAFVLLGKIEGLDVDRGVGYTLDKTSGHGWAYFREDSSSKYRLICPTWGGNDRVDFPKGSGNHIRFLNYKTFLAPRSFYQDTQGEESNFYDSNENKDLLSYEKPDGSVFANEKLPGQIKYDFLIDSIDELTNIFKASIDACKGDSFSVCVIFNDKAALDAKWDCAENAGISQDEYQFAGVGSGAYNRAYNLQNITFLFTKIESTPSI